MSMWSPIPLPKVDILLGYEYTDELAAKASILSQAHPALARALLPTDTLFCGQLAVEFKSSAKGGTITKAFCQNMGAMAALSGSISLLISTASPEQQAKLNQDLTACIVFGLVVNETVAFTTAMWKTSDVDPQHRFSKIDTIMLTDEEPVLEFLRRVELLQAWMVERRTAIMGLVDDVTERALESARGEA